MPSAREARQSHGGFSLRVRLLLVIFGGAILPLAIVGVWLIRSAERSGEVLLAARLDEALRRVELDLSPRWQVVRQDLLAIIDADDVQKALRHEGPDSVAVTQPRRGAAPSVWVLLRTGVGTWRLRLAGPPTTPDLLVRLPAFELQTGTRLGEVEAEVPAGQVLPAAAGGAAGLGMVLAAFDPATRVSLVPLPFDDQRLKDGRFEWQGETWLARFRVLDAPHLVLALAAPLTPYTQPFSAAARRGALALLIVAVIGSAAVVLLTRRPTRALAELATAAEAVSRGELDRRVQEGGGREASAVARAFNSMTQNLRGTLEKLARQEGLASVGEFAASLAHEVRNPLTAIRIDLQSLEEETAEDATRAGAQRALRHVQRLEATVSGALRVARGGRVALDPVDLREPLGAAWRAARPEFDARGCVLHALDPTLPALPVRGDAAAIEQLFLNLLLNAAQALPHGGDARADVRVNNGYVEVIIVDHGVGIEPERLAHVFEPLASTRPNGTGLGLTIAQRIAQAHGGEVEIDSISGVGTTARVRLPRAVGA